MHGHPLLAALLGQLEALDRTARELRAPLLAGQAEALRQQVLALVSERAVLEEAQVLSDARVKRLELALEENRRRYEDSLRSFERFRQGFGMIEALRDLDGLPALLESLARLFRVGLIRLVLDGEEYADGLSAGIPALAQGELAELAGRIRAGGSRSYVGAAHQAPEGLFRGGEARRFGSCFAYPLEDRFREGAWAGIILVADESPARYSPEMATDYMEHFADALKSAVVGMCDRRKAERLRDDVERMTRHDLRSPLSAVLTLPQFLLEADNITERQRQMLKLTVEAGRRMQNMITLSLSLYRMEQGAYELEPEDLDLRALLGVVWEDIGGPYRSARIGLEVECGEDCFVCRGEELLCYTMLANLVGNALQASKPGQTVNVRLVRSDGASLVEVRNPADVPEEVRERFFEKYATAGKRGGTGLGAYTARLIARVHGGEVSMETGLGEGTLVTVRLPG